MRFFRRGTEANEDQTGCRRFGRGAAARAPGITRGQASGCGFCCWRGDGNHTLEELAGLLGRSRATLQLWLEKFRAGGVSRLLERGASPGVGSPINAQTVKAALTAGLMAGKWRTASEVPALLRTAHGIKRAQVRLLLAQSLSERVAGIGKAGRPAITDSPSPTPKQTPFGLTPANGWNVFGSMSVWESCRFVQTIKGRGGRRNAFGRVVPGAWAKENRHLGVYLGSGLFTFCLVWSRSSPDLRRFLPRNDSERGATPRGTPAQTSRTNA